MCINFGIEMVCVGLLLFGWELKNDLGFFCRDCCNL